MAWESGAGEGRRELEEESRSEADARAGSIGALGYYLPRSMGIFWPCPLAGEAEACWTLVNVLSRVAPQGNGRAIPGCGQRSAVSGPHIRLSSGRTACSYRSRRWDCSGLGHVSRQRWTGGRSVEHEASAAAAGSIWQDGDLELVGTVQARARRRPSAQDQVQDSRGQRSGRAGPGSCICRRFDSGI